MKPRGVARGDHGPAVYLEAHLFLASWPAKSQTCATPTRDPRQSRRRPLAWAEEGRLQIEEFVIASDENFETATGDMFCMFGGVVLCVGTPQGGQPIDFENPDPRDPPYSSHVACLLALSGAAHGLELGDFK